jgi:putative toxin-antitoxin system antitoxin component (TIGR02293 family)
MARTDTLTRKRARRTKSAAGKGVQAITWPVRTSPTWFVRLFSMHAAERVEVAKRGVPAVSISHLAKATGEPKEHVIALLGLSRATVDRKARANQALSVVESERVMGLAKLVGQAQAMVNESGDPVGFDAAKWVAGWLERPMPALDGRTPGEYMDTAEGQQIVAGLLERARSGTFA